MFEQYERIGAVAQRSEAGASAVTPLELNDLLSTLAAEFILQAQDKPDRIRGSTLDGLNPEQKKAKLSTATLVDVFRDTQTGDLQLVVAGSLDGDRSTDSLDTMRSVWATLNRMLDAGSAKAKLERLLPDVKAVEELPFAQNITVSREPNSKRRMLHVHVGERTYQINYIFLYGPDVVPTEGETLQSYMRRYYQLVAASREWRTTKGLSDFDQDMLVQRPSKLLPALTGILRTEVMTDIAARALESSTGHTRPTQEALITILKNAWIQHGNSISRASDTNSEDTVKQALNRLGSSNQGELSWDESKALAYAVHAEITQAATDENHRLHQLAQFVDKYRTTRHKHYPDRTQRDDALMMSKSVLFRDNVQFRFLTSDDTVRDQIAGDIFELPQLKKWLEHVAGGHRASTISIGVSGPLSIHILLSAPYPGKVAMSVVVSPVVRQSRLEEASFQNQHLGWLEGTLFPTDAYIWHEHEQQPVY